MTFEEHLRLTTTEGLTIDLTIAGLGSRFLALTLDGLIHLTILVVIGVIGFSTSRLDGMLAMGLASLAALFLTLGYQAGMETFNGGKTLGKMAVGIKVVMADGGPVRLGAALIRALFLPIDSWFLGVGTISMLLTRQNRRLGDLAAGTVVVRDRLAPTAGHLLPAATLPVGEWDVSRIGEEEVGAARRFLERAPSLPPAQRAALAERLARRLAPRVGGVDRPSDPEVFLERVVAEKTHRRGG